MEIDMTRVFREEALLPFHPCQVRHRVPRRADPCLEAWGEGLISTNSATLQTLWS